MSAADSLRDHACPDDLTPTQLIQLIRSARSTALRAEAEVLLLAVEWAHAHPQLPGDDTWHARRATALADGAPDPGQDADLDEEDVAWFGIPKVRWDAFAPFAAANGISTNAGKAVIRDALILTHRMPLTWARVVAGEVPAWRARRIAQAALGAPDDVVLYLDHAVAPRAHEVGPVTLDRLLDEAMLRLHPEERELAQLEALDARHVTLYESTLNDTGIVEMLVRGDWSDLKDFDRALSAVAEALAREGEAGRGESLDVRRSMAVGVLADPLRALALLMGGDAEAELERRGPRKKIVLHLHLSDAAVLGLDPVGFDDKGGPMLEQIIREWCGRTDSHLTIRPVLDLAGDPALNGGSHIHDERAFQTYVPSALEKERVWLRDRHCAFPWCDRPARSCDCDHVVPFGADGPTCPCNLAPLCRHHHRLKTHAGWRYTIVEPGTYLWSDPHGQQFIRDRGGTRDVTLQSQSP